MKKIIIAVVIIAIVAGFSGCGTKRENDSAPVSSGEIAPLTEAQALEAIKNYCYTQDSDIIDMESSDEYTIYWDVSTNDDGQIVVLFRSYTGALIHYYIDPLTGETYVTQYVEGITDKEEKTGDTFNARNFLG